MVTTIQTQRKRKATSSGEELKESMRASKAKAAKIKKPPTSSLFDTIVTVLVGPEYVKFSIHKRLLCDHSAYFKAALTGRFKEADEGTVKLDDEEPEVFSRFNTWLYTGCCKGDDSGTMALGPSLLFWLFAAKRLVPGLQNDIIDQLIQDYPTYDTHGIRIKRTLSAEDKNTCIAVWENSEEESRIRKFLVDFFVLNVDLEHVFTQDRAVHYPPTLSTSIMICMQKVHGLLC